MGRAQDVGDASGHARHAGAGRLPEPLQEELDPQPPSAHRNLSSQEPNAGRDSVTRSYSRQRSRELVHDRPLTCRSMRRTCGSRGRSLAARIVTAVACGLAGHGACAWSNHALGTWPALAAMPELQDDRAGEGRAARELSRRGSERASASSCARRSSGRGRTCPAIRRSRGARVSRRRGRRPTSWSGASSPQCASIRNRAWRCSSSCLPARAPTAGRRCASRT